MVVLFSFDVSVYNRRGHLAKSRELTLNPEMRYRAQANFRRPVTRLRSPTQTYERVE